MPFESAFILHLSDLHLGADSNDTEMAGYMQCLRKGYLPLVAKHHPTILDALSDQLRKVVRRISGNDYADFYLITGDISNAANSDKRFEFAEQYIMGSRCAADGPSLRLPQNRTVCVPGNHDKLFELTLTRYLMRFKNTPALDIHVEEKARFSFSEVASNGRRFIFYGIDSNLYTEGNFAQGEIDSETLTWFRSEMDEALSEGVGKRETVRILLLHHHLWNPMRVRQQWLPRPKNLWFKRPPGADSLLQQCRRGIDIIFHGHLHYPNVFKDNSGSNCLIVSGGTALQFQKGGKANSFFALEFNGMQVRLLQFDWDEGQDQFRKKKEWKYDLLGRTLEAVSQFPSTILL